jgi:hypothetical protein
LGSRLDDGFIKYHLSHSLSEFSPKIDAIGRSDDGLLSPANPFKNRVAEDNMGRIPFNFIMKYTVAVNIHDKGRGRPCDV